LRRENRNRTKAHQNSYTKALSKHFPDYDDDIVNNLWPSFFGEQQKFSTEFEFFLTGRCLGAAVCVLAFLRLPNSNQ
jgi:hypothetical protein